MHCEVSPIDTQRRFEEILKDLLVHSQFLESNQFIQHGDTTVLNHSLAVAWYSLFLSRLLHIKVNEKELIRGALLHDYFLYDWHVKDKSHSLHGFRHPYTAWRNAMKVYQLTPIEQDIIKKHMFPLTPFPPRYRESFLVCIADKVCSSYETLRRENLLKTYYEVAEQLRLCERKTGLNCAV